MYSVTVGGLVPLSQATVIEVKLTAVQVLVTVTGITAKVAVAGHVTHVLELPFTIESTRP